MNEITLLLIVALAGLIHAGFQLSVSALSLMSGHAITNKKSHGRLVTLMSAFIFGAVTMTVLLLSSLAFLLEIILRNGASPELVWSITVGLSVAVGIAVWIFYYSKGPGTSLWLPRSLAGYITERAKKTKQSGEAFTLGLVSVLAEILFIVTPLMVAALAILQLDPIIQPSAIVIYTLISLLSLLIVWAMVGSGHSLSKIQQWREKNKRFLQFICGAALIILGIYIYANEVVAPIAANGGL